MTRFSSILYATLLHGAVGFSTLYRASQQARPTFRANTLQRMSASVETERQEMQLEEQISTEINEEKKKSYLDDGFVFGLDGSGIERPKGREASLVVEGDSLETTPYQIGVVTTTFLCHAALTAACLHTLTESSSSEIVTSLEVIATVLGSWLAADLGSGILHWSVDNYGNGRTPIMGSIIAAFQGHHSAPWTITQRGFCNNVYKLCTPFGLAPILLIGSTQSYASHPIMTLFLITFSVFEILSQEFHKWSHMTPRECPWWVNDVLQKSGLTIRRTPHALHHMAPYEGNYCIISGIHNDWLDESGFFRRLEHLVYNINGVESNAWKLDEKLRERTLQGNYNKVSRYSPN